MGNQIATYTAQRSSKRRPACGWIVSVQQNGVNQIRYRHISIKNRCHFRTYCDIFFLSLIKYLPLSKCKGLNKTSFLFGKKREKYSFNSDKNMYLCSIFKCNKIGAISLTYIFACRCWTPRPAGQITTILIYEQFKLAIERFVYDSR